MQTIPPIAFGTGTQWFHCGDEKGNALVKALTAALDAGYRHIDCAQMYKTETFVGQALAEYFTSHLECKRSELFVTSKVDDKTIKSAADIRAACVQSLTDLGLAYLDLYLIHSPFNATISLVEEWQAMEALVNEGLVKRIGVSNFRIAHLQEVLQHATIPPCVNQIECHPCLDQPLLAAYCAEHGIQIASYGPLGALKVIDLGAQGDEHMDAKSLRANLMALAEKYHKTIGQICLQWNAQLGHLVITTSSNPNRLKENLSVLDFVLTPEEMIQLTELGRLLPRRFFWLKNFAPHELDL